MNEDNRALLFFAACLFFAYLLPHHVIPFPTFYNEWLTMLGIAIAMAYFLAGKRSAIKIPWVALVPVGIAAVIFMQLSVGMLSENWDALLPISYLLITGVAIVLGANIAANKDGSSRLCSVLANVHLFAALISVTIASLQFASAEIPFVPFMMLMEHGAGSYIRPYANVAQANQLALLFCLAIASVWWLFQEHRLSPSVAIAATISLLWGLALTQSRIGWIIMPSFALASWSWRGRQDFRKINSALIVGFLLVYALFVAVALPALGSTLGALAHSPADRVAGTHSVRAILYRQAWEISLTHPWFGAGWFQFGPQQVAIASDFPPSAYARYAHNIVLSFMAELGWPLALLILGTLFYWFFQSCLFRSASKQVKFATLFFIAVMVHSLVEYPLWYAYVLMPLALLVGMVHQEQFAMTDTNVPRRYMVSVLILMASGLLWAAMDYRRVVAGFWELETESIGLKLNEAALEKPAFTIFPYFYDYFRFMGTELRKDMSTQEITFMEKTTRRFGGAVFLTRMSKVYALNGREDDAVKAMLTVQSLHGLSRYKAAYEEWRHAPQKYQGIFQRLPPPAIEEQ